MCRILRSIFISNISGQHEKEDSIHLTQWAKPSHINNELIQFGEELKNVIFEMRKYKSERNLSMCADMDSLDIHTEQCFAGWFKLTEKDLKACSRASMINYIIE